MLWVLLMHVAAAAGGVMPRFLRLLVLAGMLGSNKGVTVTGCVIGKLPLDWRCVCCLLMAATQALARLGFKGLFTFTRRVVILYSVLHGTAAVVVAVASQTTGSKVHPVTYTTRPAAAAGLAQALPCHQGARPQNTKVHLVTYTTDQQQG